MENKTTKFPKWFKGKKLEQSGSIHWFSKTYKLNNVELSIYEHMITLLLNGRDIGLINANEKELKKCLKWFKSNNKTIWEDINKRVILKNK